MATRLAQLTKSGVLVKALARLPRAVSAIRPDSLAQCLLRSGRPGSSATIIGPAARQRRINGRGEHNLGTTAYQDLEMRGRCVAQLVKVRSMMGALAPIMRVMLRAVRSEQPSAKPAILMPRARGRSSRSKGWPRTSCCPIAGPPTWPPGADQWLVFEADHTRSLLFMVDGGLPVARTQTEHPLGTPVGHHERGWQVPGQSRLWLYTCRCQITPFSTSADADALVVMHRGADRGHGSVTA